MDINGTTWEQAVEWARSEPSMRDLVRVCYYDDPIASAAQRFYESEEWPAYRTLLPYEPMDKVLEVGAGRGLVSWAFAKDGCNVTALEPDPSKVVGFGAIHELMQTTGVTFTVADQWGEQLPFEDNTFDFAFCRAVLHHARDLNKMCREIFRVVKPGGKFLAVKEHIADTPEELAEFLKSHPLHHLYGGEHAFSMKEYRHALLSACFRDLKCFEQFDHPITWAPLYSLAGIRSQLQSAVSSRFGTTLGKWASANDWLVKRYSQRLSAAHRIAGRLVSFLVSKPR